MPVPPALLGLLPLETLDTLDELDGELPPRLMPATGLELEEPLETDTDTPEEPDGLLPDPRLTVGVEPDGAPMLTPTPELEPEPRLRPGLELDAPGLRLMPGIDPDGAPRLTLGLELDAPRLRLMPGMEPDDAPRLIPVNALVGKLPEPSEKSMDGSGADRKSAGRPSEEKSVVAPGKVTLARSMTEVLAVSTVTEAKPLMPGALPSPY